MGGAASRGRQTKGAADPRDAGFKLQGQAVRKADAPPAQPPSQPGARPAEARARPGGRGGGAGPGPEHAAGRGNGRRAAKPWGEKPATPQELKAAGACLCRTPESPRHLGTADCCETPRTPKTEDRLPCPPPTTKPQKRVGSEE